MTKLRELRQKRGYSMRALAEKLGCSYRTIYAYEKGLIKPSLENELRLTKILNATVEELFGDLIEDNTAASRRNK